MKCLVCNMMVLTLNNKVFTLKNGLNKTAFVLYDFVTFSCFLLSVKAL